MTMAKKDNGLARGDGTRRVLQAASQFKLRDELQALVEHELLGPAGGEEEILVDERPRERYLVGMLAPLGEANSGAQMDESLAGDSDAPEEGSEDTGTPHRDTTMPSSMGMSFCVAGDVRKITVTARWGRYLKEAGEEGSDAPGTTKRAWRRSQIVGSKDVALRDGTLDPWSPSKETPEVEVKGVARKRDGDWVVSLFLVNGQQEKDRLREERWLFQPELMVEGPEGKPIFRRRPNRRDAANLDPASAAEERAMAMLYRRQVEFAVGHGVAVHAEPTESDPELATRICTRVIPVHTLHMQTPPTCDDLPDLAGVVTDMKELAEADGKTLIVKLRPLADAYAKWIDREKQKLTAPAEGLKPHQQAAKEAIDRCARALERIRAGIDRLSKDPKAAEAFRFANRAMWLQRIRSEYAMHVRRGESPDPGTIDQPDNRRWFPFQLAFILLNIPPLADLSHPDRAGEPTSAIADLLWFPTGGGKTEAYLGLTAFTLAMRRLQGDIQERSGEHGVAVLMRYTLRLLTLQQFQRAAALICACETIRQEAAAKGDGRWGASPFRIGLWVGQKTTPNTTDEAAEAIKTQREGRWNPGRISSPAQLTSCPWCGQKIDSGKHIYVETYGAGRGRTLTFCGDPLGTCPFSRAKSPKEGLPVIVVDEELYRNPPSLLIATVDKFAQMPWNGATQVLFGQVNGRCTRHGFRTPEVEDLDSHQKKDSLPPARTEPFGPLRPPDLIIQDELHLISGPLGTLVGLYETAIDELCSWTVGEHAIRPKVIASTATIRRAGDQVAAVFTRQVNIFPPHGTDIRDNFFSLQRMPSEKTPGRRYMGVCAVGTRMKVVHMRVYQALLSAAQTLFDRHGSAADPWMTLVGYFNALRELGGQRRLVDDEIKRRLRRMDAHGLAKRSVWDTEELTSRIGSSDIPVVLDRLEVPFESSKASTKDEPPKQDQKRPIDVLLATNMISVGVDVRRLGLMVVSGQPKTTAEYIQATSRVGRTYPGLVVTAYNWARPRDLSHYERFEHYHATFYQHVEALSVTPFAKRAQDRGLAALLVSLVRLAGADFNANERAEDLDRKHPFVKRAIDAISSRAGRVLGSKQAADEVRRVLVHKVDVWLKEASRVGGGGGAKLGYKDKKDGQTLGLLRSAGVGLWQEFTCLNSLRDVEPTMGLLLDDRQMDDEPPASSGGGGAK